MIKFSPGNDYKHMLRLQSFIIIHTYFEGLNHKSSSLVAAQKWKFTPI